MSDEKIVVEIEAFLSDLIPDFMDNRKADIGKLNAALADSNYAQIRHIAHDMKGLGAGYGFQHITDLGVEIGDAAKQADADLVKQLTDQYEAYLARLEVKLV